MGSVYNLYMRIKNLIALLFLSSLAFAQTPTAQNAIDLISEAQQKVNALSSPDPSCFICQFTMSPESSTVGQSKICEDLYEASCLGSDGKSKYGGRLETLKNELNKYIIKARDKTAVLMGFKDFDDALKSKLKEAGLEVNEPLEAEAWKNLKRKDGVVHLRGDSAKKLYLAVNQCYQDREEILANQDKSKTVASQSSETIRLTEIVRKYDVFLAKYREKSIGLYAKDIPNFVSNHVSLECNSSESGTKENQKACQEFLKIKRQAINLFRIEGTPEYKEQADKFVRKNLLLKSQYPSTITTSAASGEISEKVKLEKLIAKDKLLSSLIKDSCEHYSSAAENAGAKIFEDLTDQINKAKTTVDVVIDSFYSDDKKKIATQMFQETRSDIQAIASQFVKDPTKKTQIVDGYDRLKLFWMEKPENSSYTKNNKGIMALDELKAAPSNIRALFNEDVYETFSDSSLSFFTTFNADYMPSVNMGKTGRDERVNIMPAFINFLEENPYAFLEVISHEAGHKIGLDVSRLNGYDLSLEYQELLACYKNRKSINLQSGQEDETIADYISSEVLARQISRLPSEKRQQALMSSMEAFCVLDDGHSDITFKESHPDGILRVNGILGANPNLRKAVGCNAESPEFKSCGLSKVSLPLDTINREDPKPISPSKGVQ